MTNNKKWFCGVFLMFLAFALYAQTNTAVIPIGVTLPQTPAQYWDLAIAGLTPFLVGLVRKVVPKIPSFLLPLSTPLVGIVLGLATNWLANSHLGWVDMAKAGALAVFVREAYNQAVTKQLTGGTPPPTVLQS